MNAKNFMPMLIIAGSGLSAFSQQFGAVDPLSSPKRIVRFEITDPAGADLGNPIATFNESFVRGMTFTGPNSGYYIAPGGGARGVYRFENGNTQRIGGFLNADPTGGLTLSRDESFLYAAVDERGYHWWVLLRIDFDGSYREIGPIQLPNGSQKPQIDAIAMNPATGELFGLDHWHQALIQIDPDTGQSTIVGSGLGRTVRFIGGMGFTQDGSQLFITTNTGYVYEVDAESGLVTSQMGRLPFWSSSIASIPPEFLAGDLNCDGEINAFDIEPFLVALFDPENYAGLYPDCDIELADVNGDGSIDAFDIEPFLGVLFP